MPEDRAFPAGLAGAPIAALPVAPKQDNLFAAGAEAAAEAEALVVDIEGFEGPLDVLLTLSRAQKVDLRRVSILQLAEQYLVFVAAARRLRIELAADYLVMAAWLAYLKSRLLLPEPEEAEGPTGEELAARLAFQLERLEAMRRAAAKLMARDQKGREVFARGEAEALTVRKRVTWNASLSDLLKAYARVKTRDDYEPLHVKRGAVLTIDDALKRLRALVGASAQWSVLSGYLPEGWRTEPAKRRSAMASTFAATLELVKHGEVELRQDDAFGAIYLRRTGAAGAAG